mmetsp:Transcript_111470/g.240191  ORF Transcript_111470/g.240191 Transcript_111470/m.240191 type:complete len:249 (+) Transcript_111470:473-1219(+)
MKGLASGLKVEEGVDVGEVVAEGVVSTGLADIVGVQPAAVVGGSLEQIAVGISRFAGLYVKLASFSHLSTLGDMLYHASILLISDALDVVRVVHGHLGVVLILDDRVSETISYSNTLKIDVQTLFSLISLVNSGRDSRDVVAPIALSEHKELVGQVFSVSCEELLEETIEILRDFRLVVIIPFLVTITVADARRLVNPHDVSVVVPGVGVVDSIESIRSGSARPILREKGHLGTTSGPTSQPDDKRVV